RRGIPAPPASSPADGRGAAAPLGYVRIIGNVKAPGALSATSAHSNGGLPRRERFPRGGQSPEGRVLGRPDPACDRELPDQRHPVRPAIHLRAWSDEDGVRLDERLAGATRLQAWQCEGLSVECSDGRESACK